MHHLVVCDAVDGIPHFVVVGGMHHQHAALRVELVLAGRDHKREPFVGVAPLNLDDLLDPTLFFHSGVRTAAVAVDTTLPDAAGMAAALFVAAVGCTCEMYHHRHCCHLSIVRCKIGRASCRERV